MAEKNFIKVRFLREEKNLIKHKFLSEEKSLLSFLGEAFNNCANWIMLIRNIVISVGFHVIVCFKAENNIG